MIYDATKRAARGRERGPWAAAQSAPVPARTSSETPELKPGHPEPFPVAP